jgi:RES domain-containing protein
LIHDPLLVDQLGALEAIKFDGEVFRATRKSLDPLAPSTSGGRWVPKDTAPILYTSCEPEGALAEIAFHWAQLTPLPSKPVALHRLRLTTKRTMRLLRANLETFGVTWERYGELNYARTQEIGAAVAFLGYDGLLAPSARWACENLMLFLDNHHAEENTLQVTHTEEVDWLAWARSHGLVSAGE